MKIIEVTTDRLKQIIEAYERDKPHINPSNIYVINQKIALVVVEKHQQERVKFRGYVK